MMTAEEWEAEQHLRPEERMVRAARGTSDAIYQLMQQHEDRLSDDEYELLSDAAHLLEGIAIGREMRKRVL